MITKMERDFTEEHKYLLAKKRVEKIKGFYVHLIVYILVNIFISGVVIFGMMNDGNKTFSEVYNHFGVYSTWLFWGIGLFFHWLGVFGSSIFFGKEWEKKQVEKYMGR